MVNNKKMSKYEKLVKQAQKKFNPRNFGGCVQATRWLIRKCPELQKKIVQIKNNHNGVTHCIALTPDNQVIDTQMFQFCILGLINESVCKKGIYSIEEHESLLPRYKVGDC
jgi:hypothetical protein